MARASEQSARSGMRNRPRQDDDEPKDTVDDDEQPRRRTRAQELDDNGPDEQEQPRRRQRQADPDDDEQQNDEHPKERGRRARHADADDDAPKSGGKGGDDVIDLSSADENAVGKSEVVPRGKYRCEVKETEFVTFKTGSKGMKIQLEVIEGDYAKSKTRKSGKRFFTNLVMSAAAADLLKSGLKALGVDKKMYNSSAFSAKMLQRIADSGDLIGNEVVADVKIRSYEGEKQNEVRRLMLPTTKVDDADDGEGGFLED